MATFLQIVGLAGLILIIALVLGYFYLKRRIGSFVEDFADQLTAATQSPSRVTLVTAEDPEWTDEVEHEQCRRELSQLGFNDAGCYEVEEMPGVLVHGLVDEPNRFVAVVCDHPAVGVWVDLVAESADGELTLTATNNEQGAELDEPPFKRTLRRPDASIEVLMQIFRREVPAERRELTASGFAAYFETAYAREMDWREGRPIVAEPVAAAELEPVGAAPEDRGYTQEAIDAVGEVMRGEVRSSGLEEREEREQRESRQKISG